MNRKMKLRYRAVLSLMLSAVLFCMPVLAFSMNGDNAIDARAEETVESGTEEGTEGKAEGKRRRSGNIRNRGEGYTGAGNGQQRRK